jgi:hypothetical protein
VATPAGACKAESYWDCPSLSTSTSRTKNVSLFSCRLSLPSDCVASRSHGLADSLVVQMYRVYCSLGRSNADPTLANPLGCFRLLTVHSLWFTVYRPLCCGGTASLVYSAHVLPTSPLRHRTDVYRPHRIWCFGVFTSLMSGSSIMWLRVNILYQLLNLLTSYFIIVFTCSLRRSRAALHASENTS